VKYMANGGFRYNPLMRLTLLGSLVFLAILWLTSFAIYFQKMSLNPTTVVDYYLGDEAAYRPARTVGSMLEVTHMHMAGMALVLLLVTHLFIFVPIRRSLKVAAIFAAFSGALLDEGAGWLVRFVSPSLAVLKPVGFLVLQGSLAALVAGLTWYLLSAVGKTPPGSDSEVMPSTGPAGPFRDPSPQDGQGLG
jgi:hypothetical protein